VVSDRLRVCRVITLTLMIGKLSVSLIAGAIRVSVTVIATGTKTVVQKAVITMLVSMT
jgi:hypothetical protein